MKLKKIRFKNFTFDYNPKELTIEYKRSFAEHKIPFMGSLIQDIGRQKKIIKGVGCFFGDNCTQTFRAFSKLVYSDESGVLVLPETEPIDAFLCSVVAKATNVADRIDYSFEFWENTGLEYENEIVYVKNYHIVSSGETLWSIAEKYSTTASELMKLNPSIKRPDDIKEGQKVIISL